MSNEVSPLTTVQDRIKDKIKAEFADLIPDEMWQKMVQGVVAEFTTDARDRYDGSKIIRSPMKQIIYDELREHILKRTKDAIAELDQKDWADGHKVAGEAVRKFINENMTEIMASIQKSIVETTVMNAVSQIRNSIQGYR